MAELALISFKKSFPSPGVRVSVMSKRKPRPPKFWMIFTAPKRVTETWHSLPDLRIRERRGSHSSEGGLPSPGTHWMPFRRSRASKCSRWEVEGEQMLQMGNLPFSIEVIKSVIHFVATRTNIRQDETYEICGGDHIGKVTLEHISLTRWPAGSPTGNPGRFWGNEHK